MKGTGVSADNLVDQLLNSFPKCIRDLYVGNLLHIFTETNLDNSLLLHLYKKNRKSKNHNHWSGIGSFFANWILVYIFWKLGLN